MGTFGIALGVLLVVSAILWLGFPLAKLIFYVLNQAATFRYNNAIAAQNRVANARKNEKLYWEAEKVRLEAEVLQLKIQRTNAANGNNAVLPPVAVPPPFIP